MNHTGGVMATQHIAVIDVGKTNKKVLIFNHDLTVVDSAYKSFDEYVEDGIHYEDVENATAWFMEQLGLFAKKYDIAALSITTHGSTALCVDRDGNLAVPPVAYTTDAGEEFDTSFYEEFGSVEELQRATATAKIGNMVNEGKVLYFCKRKWPDKFENIHMVLHFPQYFGYLFTGKNGAEPTFTGCHTYLYDPINRKYSTVAEKLGLTGKLPDTISKSWEVLGTVKPDVADKTGLSTNCIVTMGIHDSNSSLLPYLVKGYDNFVLNSTGTWCVAMHPTDTFSFEDTELGKLVYFNLDAFFNPVKTSIFMGGLEFDTYVALLRDIAGAKGYPPFDRDRYAKIIADRDLFILPSVVKGTGIFPNALPRACENGEMYGLEDITAGKRVPPFFNDYETAYAVLVVSLALQTRAALDMTGYRGAGTIFTEGGFRKNDAYNRVLATLYPDSTAVLTNLSEATAFGAALLARAALDKTTPRETAGCFEIETTAVSGADLPGLDAYADAFTRLVNA
ncbi:MAG: carbohydrate kinase [Chitinivibrionales bacterium]|nr:carbohydrate kinase [Chitinivibrionales bacterium]MBD3394565.1 carbohydrate kinase [Chitinivibrionales bacterium]